jgi:hypothetical protein
MVLRSEYLPYRYFVNLTAGCIFLDGKFRQSEDYDLDLRDSNPRLSCSVFSRINPLQTPKLCPNLFSNSVSVHGDIRISK